MHASKDQGLSRRARPQHHLWCFAVVDDYIVIKDSQRSHKHFHISPDRKDPENTSQAQRKQGSHKTEHYPKDSVHVFDNGTQRTTTEMSFSHTVLQFYRTAVLEWLFHFGGTKKNTQNAVEYTVNAALAASRHPSLSIEKNELFLPDLVGTREYPGLTTTATHAKDGTPPVPDSHGRNCNRNRQKSMSLPPHGPMEGEGGNHKPNTKRNTFVKSVPCCRQGDRASKKRKDTQDNVPGKKSLRLSWRKVYYCSRFLSGLLIRRH